MLVMGSSYGIANANMETEQNQIDKTRMMVQARSEGDGMETATNTEAPSSNFQNFCKIDQPKANSLAVPSAKRKEPKFVPYEPYKAAVCPIIPMAKEKRIADKVLINASLIKPLASKVIKESSSGFTSKKSQPITFGPHVEFIEPAPASLIPVDSSTWLQEKVLLEDRIQRLEEEKKELMTQFSIQTKVNADLKKLLVASLGEDMQAKVQYMSEDKAKLGEHVLLCSQKLSQNNEELEKLTFQRDMWKSKFEASSLLINELASWKVVLSRKFNEGTEAIENLLEEHQELYQQLSQAFSMLISIQEAFDASAKRNSPCPESPWNMLQLASATRALSEELRSRLLGIDEPVNDFEKHKNISSFTHGECIAKELLDSLKELPDLTKLEMKKTNNMMPGAKACSVLPHTCNKETTVNCCRHCSGKVHFV